MCGSTRTPPHTSLDRCGLECTLWLKCKASFPYSIDSSSRNVKQAFHFSPQCRMFSVSPLFLACCAIIRRSSSLLMVNSRPFTDRRRQSAIEMPASHRSERNRGDYGRDSSHVSLTRQGTRDLSATSRVLRHADANHLALLRFYRFTCPAPAHHGAQSELPWRQSASDQHSCIASAPDSCGKFQQE